MRLDFKNKKPLSEEALSQQDIQYAVEDAKLQLQSDILATKKSLAETKEQLNIAETTAPLDSRKIINLQIEVEGLEDGVKRLEQLQKKFGF